MLVPNSFTASGGDGFAALASYDTIDLGITHADALRLYIERALHGVVEAVQASNTSTRVNILPSP